MPKKDDALYPSITPLYMKKEWPGLPSEIRKLHQAFENPKLSEIEKELGNARKLVGGEYPEEVREMSLEERKQRLKNGELQINNKNLYINGGAVRNFAINHIHDHAHATTEHDLGTDASPLALKIIMNAAKGEILRDEKVAVQETKDDFHNLNLIFQKGHERKKFKMKTFPLSEFKDAPRMFLDYRKRHFTDSGLYYDVKKGHIIDHGNGLAHIAEKKVVPVSGDLKSLIKKEPLHAITYIANLNSVNEHPRLDAETRMTLITADLNRVDQKKITDAFTKGTINAIDKKAYIDLLNEAELLPKIFKGIHNLNTNIKPVKSKIPALTIAQILRHHFTSAEFLKSRLRHLGFQDSTINDIILLVKLPYYNNRTTKFTSEFDINRFIHEDRKKSSLSENSISEYARALELPNARLIEKALKDFSFSSKHLTEPAIAA